MFTLHVAFASCSVYVCLVRYPRVFSLCVFLDQLAVPDWLPALLAHLLTVASAQGIEHSVLCGFSRGAYWTVKLLCGLLDDMPQKPDGVHQTPNG
jgi:hypothetical protein